MVNFCLDKIQTKLVYYSLNHSLLVIAPPGFGKTTIMAKRIQYLIETDKIKFPYRILGLTFSNAASNEMLKKIKEEIGKIKQRVDIINFHAFGYKLLRQYGNLIDINRQFDIMDESDEKVEFISFMEKGVKGPHDINELYNRYITWKRETVLKLDTKFVDSKYDNIFKKFQIYLERFQQKNGCITFDYILKFTISLFEEFPQILEQYRAKYKYILVDEFQDTNNLQYKILKILANGLNSTKSHNKKIDVFILIDPFQAIYLFQGADPSGFEKLVKDFDIISEILPNNYRTNSEILKALCNSYRKCKGFKSINILKPLNIQNHVPEEKLLFTICENEYCEADYVLKNIKQIIKKKVPLEEICIIARTGYRLDSIKSKLEENSISYIFLPDFMSTKLNQNFKNLFNKSNEILKNYDRNDSLHSVLREIINNSAYINDIVIETILEFSKKIDREHRQKELMEKIQIFRNDIFLQINWSEIYKKKIKNKIFISTVHQVKGLEFSYLFFCGLENYTIPTRHICPHSGNCINPELFEEKNIFYVGVTRPKCELFLSSIRFNNQNKKRRVPCFIKKIEHLIEFQFINCKIPEDDIYCWNL